MPVLSHVYITISSRVTAVIIETVSSIPVDSNSAGNYHFDNLVKFINIHWKMSWIQFFVGRHYLPKRTEHETSTSVFSRLRPPTTLLATFDQHGAGQTVFFQWSLKKKKLRVVVHLFTSEFLKRLPLLGQDKQNLWSSVTSLAYRAPDRLSVFT